MKARGSMWMTPNSAMLPPQSETATSTARPWRRMRVTQPAVEAPINAPTAIDENNAPTISGPWWNCFTARIGNSARGIPKIMATRSTTNVACKTRLPRRNVNASRIARAPVDGCSAWFFGICAGSRSVTKIVAANETTSAAYA